MAPNKYQPHILVLPEDYANAQLINGLILKAEFSKQRQIQVMPWCGGWVKVKEKLLNEYIDYLFRWETGVIILLIDFDGDENRPVDILRDVPTSLKDRIFIFGSRNEPEDIGFGSLERVGSQLADACSSGEDGLWAHSSFVHNKLELERFRRFSCKIIF